MRDTNTGRNYMICRVDRMVGRNKSAVAGDSDGSCKCEGLCRTGSSCHRVATRLARWRPKFQEGKHAAAHDAEAFLEQSCVLLPHPSARPTEMIEQRREDETYRLLQLQPQRRVKSRQERGADGMLDWRSSSGSPRYQPALNPHRRRHLRVQCRHKSIGYGRHRKKQENQQGCQAGKDGKEGPKVEEEESEARGDCRRASMHGAAVFHRRKEFEQGVYIRKRPVMGEYYPLRESSLVWPLQRQHELLPVKLRGGCYFREAAFHGQSRTSGADLHHFNQVQTRGALLITAQSLPSLEKETLERRTKMIVEGKAATSTEGQERGKFVMPGGAEEAEDGSGQASFSMMLRPNVLSGLRSRSASSSLGGSHFSLRSLRGGESIKDDYTVNKERKERRAAGESPRAVARQAGISSSAVTDKAIVRRDVEGEGEVVAATGGVATDRTSFIATAADAGSAYRKSAVSTCWYWNRRILCSRTRWHYLVFLSIYAFLIGPIYLNWAPLREILFRSGAYAWECDPNERNPSSLRYIFPDGEGDVKKSKDNGSGSRGSPAACTLQRLRVGNLYTVCAAADFGFSFFGGLVVDWLGPKTGSLLGSTSMLAGWLLLSLSSESVPAYLPGMVLFGIGIDMAFYGTLSVSRLFPGHANIVIAAVVGMRGLGLMSPLILNWIRLPFTAVMLGYALGGLLPAVLIASVYAPWKPFQADTLKKKKTKTGASSLLPADRLTSSSHALRMTAPSSHDLSSRSRVAVQDTATDFLYTEEAAGTERSTAKKQQQLLLGGTMQESSDGDLSQQQTQKGRHASEPKQDDLNQHSSVVVAAVSSEVAADKIQQLPGFRGLVSEDEQRHQLQTAAAVTSDEHESHLDIIYGEDTEEGWLSDRGIEENETRRLFNPVPQLQQEQQNPLDKRGGRARVQRVSEKKRLEQESKFSRKGQETGPGRCWPPKPERGTAIDSMSSGAETRMLAAHSFALVRRPEDFFSDLNCSIKHARPPLSTAAAACSVAHGGRLAIAGGDSTAGASSGTARDLGESGVSAQRKTTVEHRKLARRTSVLLQEQQMHTRELTDTSRTQHQASQIQRSEEEVRRNAQVLDREEEQLQQSDVSPNNSLDNSIDNSGERQSQMFASRRTRSTTADEECPEAWGAGDANAGAVGRNVAAENREQQDHDVKDEGGSGACISKGPETCRLAATASCAAASTETPGNSTAAAVGEGVELRRLEDLKGGGTTTNGAQNRQDMHASTSLEKHIPLPRPVSSRQFPHSFRGRMQYFTAYIKNHPWSVSSAAFLRDYLFTLVYLPVVPYFAFSLMRSVYFSDASEDLVPSAIGTLHVLLACVCVVPPITGLLADLWSIMPCIVLINTTGTLVMLGSLLAHLTHIVAFEYVAVVFYMPFAAVLTNQVYFYIADAFPQRHLGKLCGFACSIGGVVSLSVTSMFEFSVKTKGGFTIMLSIMLAISVLCYGFIAMLYIGQKRVKRRNDEAAAAAAALDVAAADASQKLLPCASTATLAVVTTAAPPRAAEQERSVAAAAKASRMPSNSGAVPSKFAPEAVRADDWAAEELAGKDQPVAAARETVTAGVGR